MAVGERVDAAVGRAAARRPDLGMAVRHVADALTAGEGAEMIHQAALQRFLWWQLPRRYPQEEWAGLAAAAAELLDELGLARLAGVTRSAQTTAVLAAWAEAPAAGAAAFRRAQGSSGVEPHDTPVLAWGTIMGAEETGALEAVERALGEAVGSGALIPGVARWRSAAAAITERVLSAPLDIPPGQCLAGLVITERLGHWIDLARHPALGKWRAAVANRLLHPIDAPADADGPLAPVRWLLELTAAPGGAELTQSHYLARASVLEAVERFAWWDWPKAPRSEAEVHQLGTVREAATRLRLVRRRGRRLLITTRGAQLLSEPAELWRTVAGETEDGEEFTRTVTELVGLRLLGGTADIARVVAEITPVLAALGWSTDGAPIAPAQVGYAIWRPLRWWRLFGAVDEVEASWERGTGRQLTSHTVALRPDGERMVLAYLRGRAAGPRHRF